MFFHPSHFKQVLEDDQASIIAKIANQVIDDKAKVLYGILLQDGTCTNFTTEQKPNDTHVCLGIGLSEMGFLKPSESPVSVDRVSREDMLRALEEKNKRLEKELRLLKEKRLI